MHWTTYIVSPIVGAVIGYFTNWLAIKMLFRPHYEKRILGKKMPFTPGIIPKEKERIAVKVAQAIGEHLLTEEDLVQSIASLEMDTEINKLIDQYVVQFKNEQRSTKEILQNIYSKEELEVKLDKLSSFVVEWLISQGTSEGFKEKIKGLVSDVSIVDEIENAFCEWSEEGVPKLLHNLLEYLKREDVAQKLQDHLRDLIVRKLGGFIANFVKPETIYEMGIVEFAKYIEEPKNIEYITKVVQSILKEEIGKSDKWSTKVSDLIGNTIANETVRKMLDTWIRDVMQSILVLPISFWMNYLSDDFINRVKISLTQRFHSLIMTQAPVMIKKLDIESIVQNRISQFEPSQTEEIIVSVMNKELAAITWLGGLLGFIMGFITPILSV